MKIYHFANLVYGLPFIEYYKTYPIDALSQLDITIVISRHKSTKRRFQRLRKIRQKYRDWRDLRNCRQRFRDVPVRILFVTDVNSDFFLHQIPNGSIGICSGFNQIFSQGLINQFEVCLNVHPSILPYYRGPVPSYWVLAYQESQTGYTIHKMTKRIDEGEIVYQEAIQINSDDSEALLDQRLARSGRMALKELILAKLAGRAFQKRLIDANQIYQTRISYRSFPNQS